MDSEIESDNLRADIVRFTITVLESEKGYIYVTALGRGTYGDVYKMHDPSRGSDIAVKIITSDNIAEIELTAWPHLRHANIVPLLDYLTLESLNTIIYIMPVHDKTLHGVLQDEYFREWEGSLMQLKTWICEILCGLEYLHSIGLCHLDLKVDNILISKQHTAMLCDFSFLNITTKPLEKYDLGLPVIYRPPEACYSLGDGIKIDGASYDMWSFGVMLVEIFTRFILAKTVSNEKCWYTEVYPTLFHALQEVEFEIAMTDTFPVEDANSVEVSLALNFIHVFLNSDYKKRWTPSRAMKHAFLGIGLEIELAQDPIWMRSGRGDVCRTDSQLATVDDGLNDQEFEHHEVQLSNCLDNSSTELIVSSYEETEQSAQKDEEKSEKEHVPNYRKVIKWFRKRYSSFGKMFKCCSP